MVLYTILEKVICKIQKSRAENLDDEGRKLAQDLKISSTANTSVPSIVTHMSLSPIVLKRYRVDEVSSRSEYPDLRDLLPISNFVKDCSPKLVAL